MKLVNDSGKEKPLIEEACVIPLEKNTIKVNESLLIYLNMYLGSCVVFPVEFGKSHIADLASATTICLFSRGHYMTRWTGKLYFVL